MEDVTIKNNGNPFTDPFTPGTGELGLLDVGLLTGGKGITICNADISGNFGSGLYIDTNQNFRIFDINLEGEISIHNNQGNGLSIIGRNGTGTLNISADLNIYLNGRHGIQIPRTANTDIILEKGGSIMSCNNKREMTSQPYVDIFNSGTGSFLSSGKGRYTCDTKNGEGVDPLIDIETGEVFEATGEVPDCKACPACL